MFSKEMQDLAMFLFSQSMSPVLKWAGGKSQLLPAIKRMMPPKYGCYYEPFIGGAAVLLSVVPKKAIVNDINPQLVNLYQQLKLCTDDVIHRVQSFDSVECNKDYYYLMREKYNRKIAHNELDSECAALMIWINKHCFNGLYRVNRKGEFNVPYNNKTKGSSIDASNLSAIGNYFRTIDLIIKCSDFEEVCHTVEAGDFVYFDSPYVPESETADFTTYAKDGFRLEDHERLSRLFKSLDLKGAKLMLSNNDLEYVHDLYHEYHFTHLDVKRMINRDGLKRTGREVIITNYEMD